MACKTSLLESDAADLSKKACGAKSALYISLNGGNEFLAPNSFFAPEVWWRGSKALSSAWRSTSEVLGAPPGSL